MKNNQWQGALWKIAEEVADPDIEPVFFTEKDFDEVPYCWYCRYCHGQQSNIAHREGEDFPHESDCIVMLARELLQFKKDKGS